MILMKHWMQTCLQNTAQTSIILSTKSVVPKLLQALTQIKVEAKSYYPEYFAVIAHNMEHCGFGSTLTPAESHTKIMYRNSRFKK